MNVYGFPTVSQIIIYRISRTIAECEVTKCNLIIANFCRWIMLREFIAQIDVCSPFSLCLNLRSLMKLSFIFKSHCFVQNIVKMV